MSPDYKPTLGMLRVLVEAEGATELDAFRCRQRGLIDHANRLSVYGHAAVSREVQRCKDLGHG